MTEWYYADRQGQQRGPVSDQELLALSNADGFHKVLPLPVSLGGDTQRLRQRTNHADVQRGVV